MNIKKIEREFSPKLGQLTQVQSCLDKIKQVDNLLAFLKVRQEYSVTFTGLTEIKIEPHNSDGYGADTFEGMATMDETVSIYRFWR